MNFQFLSNNSSSIFKSIFPIDLHKQNFLNLSSLVKAPDSCVLSIDSQGRSKILRKQFINKQTTTYNIQKNWFVCKNKGMSQDQQQESQNEHKNQQKVDKKKQNKSQIFLKTQTKEQITHKTNNKNKQISQTKNIPKNYGKAIIGFLQTYQYKCYKITQKYNIKYSDLLADLKEIKKSINTIADLRDLWTDYKYAQCMRAISFEFFRKHSLSYIFNSRIEKHSTHIKYRQRLCEAVGNPHNFKNIKPF